MELWRRIDTWDAAPRLAMGLDEALLLASEATPCARFYTWSPDTLSLGYFQRRVDVPRANEAGALVRRITGGGAIHHVRELTFSIAAPLDHPLFRGATPFSYERVHRALAAALAHVGVEARLRGSNGLASDREGTGMCFHDSTPLDLVWNDRKGVGSAQRRTKGRVLHHGSIKIGTSELEGDIATLPVAITPQELAELVATAFAASFDARLERDEPRADEIERAQVLGERYLDPEFVDRR